MRSSRDPWVMKTDVGLAVEVGVLLLRDEYARDVRLGAAPETTAERQPHGVASGGGLPEILLVREVHADAGATRGDPHDERRLRLVVLLEAEDGGLQVGLEPGNGVVL